MRISVSACVPVAAVLAGLVPMISGHQKAVVGTSPSQLWTLDDGIFFGGLTNTWYKKYRDSPRKWVASGIDWKDKSFEDVWKEVRIACKGKRNRGEVISEYAQRYKQSHKYQDLVRYGACVLSIGSPSGELESYFQATYDTKFGSSVIQEFLDRPKREYCPVEAKLMLLLDNAYCGNSFEKFEQVGRSLMAHGDDSIEVKIVVSMVAIRKYVHKGISSKQLSSSIKELEDLHIKNPASNKVREAMAYAHLAKARLKKSKKDFDQAMSMFELNCLSLDSGDAYDRLRSKRDRKAILYWKTTKHKQLGI